MSRILRLWSVDSRLSWRDPLTVFCLIGPVLLTLALRLLLPRLMAVLPWQIDLGIYQPIVGASFALFPPMLYGMVFGFLMLDEKDDGTYLALQVTPLSRSTLTWYRVISPVLQAVVVVLIVLPLSGMVKLSAGDLIAAAILCGLEAPMSAFALAALAGNKIEGLALSKLLGLPMMLPLTSLFVPGTWQWVFWPVPFYWPFHFILRAVAGASRNELVLIWMVGIAVHLAILIAITRRPFGARA